jgi:hypothetical protein
MMNTYVQQTVKIIVTVCVCVSIFFVLPASYGEALPEIWHNSPTCAIVGSPIRIFADVVSPTPVKEVRVYFRRQGTMPFYFVRMKSAKGGTYTGMLPAPMETVNSVEYRILVVDRNENIVTSPLFSILIRKGSECPQSQIIDKSPEILVYAEQGISPKSDFSGENVQWKVSDDRGERYLNGTLEIQGQSPTALLSSSTKDDNNSKIFKLDKKTIIGLGIGIGTVAAIGAVLAGGDEEDGIEWNTAIDDPAENVIAELYKTPEVQTACGTIVTNQLYITNNTPEPLSIGTINYEVILTRDKPAGSCENGRIGAFAPNLATVVLPAETALIRQWSNEVNPCSGCPYLLAKCNWVSRYVVHTSAGSAVVESTFTAEGDLCETPATKALDGGSLIKGDFEP